MAEKPGTPASATHSGPSVDVEKSCCDDSKQKSNPRMLLFGIALGQVLSLCLAIAIIVNERLQRPIPTFQSVSVYLLLALVYLPLTIVEVRRTRDLSFLKEKTQMKVWKLAFSIPNWALFATAGVLDLEANALAVASFQYTSLLNILMTNCLTLPMVIGLSIVFLRRRYSLYQVASVTVSLMGLVLFLSSRGEESEASLYGILIASISSFLYACSNLCQEYLAVKYGDKKYLGVVGAVGLVVGLAQAFALEYESLISIVWSAKDWLFLLYAVILTGFYVLVPLMLMISSAAMFNMSLLTSNFFCILASLVLGSSTEEFTTIYFVSFGITILGLVLYNIALKQSEK